MRCRTLMGGLAALALIAGGPAHAGQDADAKELAAYRLTKDGLDKYTAVLRGLAGELKKDPRFLEMAKLEAEMERLGAKEDPTDADMKRMEEIGARIEQLEESTNISMSEGSLSDIEAQILKNAPVARAIAAGGFTPREYAKFTLVLFQASMAVGMQKAGLLKELPKDVSAENVAFVRQHEEALRQLQKEMEALAPGGRER